MKAAARQFLYRLMVVMAVSFLGAAVAPVNTFAQDDTDYFGNAYQTLSETADGGGMVGLSGAIKAISKAATSVLKIFLGIGAIIMLVMIMLRIMEGNRDAAMKLFWWLISYIAGFIVLVVIDKIDPTISAAGGKGFSSIKQEIAEVLMALTKLIAMISVTLAAIHMMQGEQEGARKFIVTVIVSVIVCLFLGLIAGV